MMEFIVKYWVEWLFGLIIAGMGVVYKQLKSNINQNKAVKDGIKGILHNEIIYRCKKILIIGYVTPDDLEELEYLFKPYKELQGNGTAEKLINRVYQLPMKEMEESKNG